MFDGFSAPLARQVIAETLFVLDLGLLCFIAAHLCRELRRRGWRRTFCRLGNMAALALGIHVSGLALIRGWSTLMYLITDQGGNPKYVEEIYPVALVGLVVAVVGMAFCIRIFSPVRWGNWGWLLTFMAVIGFLGFIHGA